MKIFSPVVSSISLVVRLPDEFQQIHANDSSWTTMTGERMIYETTEQLDDGVSSLMITMAVLHALLHHAVHSVHPIHPILHTLVHPVLHLQLALLLVLLLLLHDLRPYNFLGLP